MNYILFDSDVRNSLLPFTYTRPVADIRIGILTIREKWEFFLGFTTTTITEEYLEDKYPMVEMNIDIIKMFANSLVIPPQRLSLSSGYKLRHSKFLQKYDGIYL